MQKLTFLSLLGLFLFLYVEYKLVCFLVVVLGPLSVLGLMFCFFFLGMHVLRMNVNAWRKARIYLNGEPNVNALNCTLLLVAALLMIIPGVITGLLGLLLLLPPVRSGIIRYLRAKSRVRTSFASYSSDKSTNAKGNRQAEANVIDVDAHETKSIYEEIR